MKHYTLNADDFLDALTRVATQFQLPMGVEWSENRDTKRKVSGSWNNVDVRQVIQDLVKAHNGYEFDAANGVVHVFPSRVNAGGKDFASLKLRTFVVNDQVPEVATHQLRDLVKSNVSPRPPAKPGVIGGSVYSQGAEVGDKEISLRLENVTVRDALDKIALASDRKIWVVTFTDEPLTPTGFRRTRTLWISRIAVNEQPVWDSLRWGDPVPPQR